MATLPGFLLTDTVTVEAYSGVGPTYGTATLYKAHVQECRKLITDKQGAFVAEACAEIWFRLGPSIPAGSRITVRGLTCTAVYVDVFDLNGLPVPEHLDVMVERAEFVPTTTVTVTRGTPSTDAYGDKVDNTTVVASSLPASFIEDEQRRWQPVDRRGGTVETFGVRLRSTARILEGDRLTDAAGLVFQVMGVTYPPTAAGPALGSDDVRLTVRRVSATSALPS